MALNSSYLITTKNLEPFFNSLLTAKAPETFTLKFLENLEFKSTNDRLYIGLLKGLGFLDANGVPMERYFKFLDQTQSKQILAEAVREAYSDLFAVNVNAQTLTIEEVKNKLKTLTQGKNSDEVLRLMAKTFVALCSYAEWKTEPKKVDDKKPKEKPVKEVEPEEKPNLSKLNPAQLHYNIQIHLPESRDQAVYDALFKALKEHLF